MNDTDPSARSHIPPPGCRLQKWRFSHTLVRLPGRYMFGRLHEVGAAPGFNLARTPRTTSPSPKLASSYPAPAHTQPYSKSLPGSFDGGRSPIMTVLLVPSVMSAILTLEFT